MKRGCRALSAGHVAGLRGLQQGREVVAEVAAAIAPIPRWPDFRRIRPGFPVLFYTGRANRPWASKIAAAGFGSVVFKPLPMDKMGVAIRDAMMEGINGTARRPRVADR